jgi:hypothetical protein
VYVEHMGNDRVTCWLWWGNGEGSTRDLGVGRRWYSRGPKPPVILEFKFHPQPRTEGFLIYSTLKCARERMVHRGQQNVKN